MIKNSEKITKIILDYTEMLQNNPTKKMCTICGCNKPAIGKNLCEEHHQKAYKEKFVSKISQR